MRRLGAKIDVASSKVTWNLMGFNHGFTIGFTIGVGKSTIQRWFPRQNFHSWRYRLGYWRVANSKLPCIVDGCLIGKLELIGRISIKHSFCSCILCEYAVRMYIYVYTYTYSDSMYEHWNNRFSPTTHGGFNKKTNPLNVDPPGLAPPVAHRPRRRLGEISPPYE